MKLSGQLFICIAIVTISLIPAKVHSDIFVLKDGAGTLEGKIIKETETQYSVKVKTGGVSTFPKSWVQTIKKTSIPDGELYTKQDLYFERLGKADQKDAGAQLELARWCLKNSTPENGLSELAVKHFKIAKELNPSLSKSAGKELFEAEDKEAGKLYNIAETKFKDEEFFTAEQLIFSIISIYPESTYADKARELLTKIWGSERAAKLLKEGSTLPEIVLSGEGLRSVSPGSDSEKFLENYLMKCVNKAVDCEERAREVPKEKKKGYYIAAINCYNVVLLSDKPELKKLAGTKKQELIASYFGTDPLPDNYATYSQMGGYLKDLEDKAFLKKICLAYFKSGDELYKKAKKAKQPEKGEKAKTAYFYFSIVNDFSENEKIKQEAFNNMVECQRLERALK